MAGALSYLLLAPGWLVLLAVGTLVLLEDALFVGFVLPGETAAILAGVTTRVGHTPLWGALVTVTIAAIVGDTIGYEVGRRYGSRLVELRALGRYRERIDDAGDLLARRGGAAVLLGRSVAFLRAVVPALAGAARMPYRRFFTYNAIGGILWATTVVMLGYAAGSSYARVQHGFGRFGVAVFVAVGVASAIAWRLQSGRLHRRLTETAPVPRTHDTAGRRS